MAPSIIDEIKAEDKVAPSDGSSIPTSPTSTTDSEADSGSSRSNSVHSIPHYDGSVPELILTPHLSRANSAVGRKACAEVTLKRTVTSRSNATTSDPVFEVDFADDDLRNPQLWPLWLKGIVIAIMSYGTTCVVLYSTSYTAAIPGLEESFGISEIVGILGVTTYMIGIACGSIVLAPLSEMYGRRPIYIGALALFTIFVLPSALAQNISTILVTRFFGAFAASAMISNAPGTVNDIVDEDHRALAFSIWSIGPMNGPVIGPVVGGFVFQYMGWRWTNWIVIILAGVAFVLIAIIPETYAPAILRKRAKNKRKETGDDRYWSRYDDKKAILPLLKTNLTRPFVLAVTEPIL